MVVRKCHKCGAVWRSELSQCAFCGQEGEDQSRPQITLAVLDRPGNGSPKAPEAGTKLPGSFVPPAHEPKPEPPAIKLPGSFVPPAPGLPSAYVPLVFGLLGLAAAALLPMGAWAVADRTAAVLVFLGVALLAPFAPLAWWAGGRYAERCDDLGFRPSTAARSGRLLGVAVTLLLAAEGSALAFLRALERLRE